MPSPKLSDPDTEDCEVVFYRFEDCPVVTMFSEEELIDNDIDMPPVTGPINSQS